MMGNNVLGISLPRFVLFLNRKSICEFLLKCSLLSPTSDSILWWGPRKQKKIQWFVLIGYLTLQKEMTSRAKIFGLFSFRQKEVPFQ